jgi:superfamily II DNA or RNA helicase
MRLRPRQSLFVERSLAALCDHGNTLSIASTGFGKTIALSAVVAKSLDGSDAKACILAHRDELTAQNRTKFGRVAPEITSSVFDSETK